LGLCRFFHEIEWFFEVFQIPRTGGSLILIFIFIFKYLEPAGITKINYPPHNGNQRLFIKNICVELVSKLYLGLIIPWSPSLFSLAIYSQKRKIKLESAKIECFLRFSIAIIPPKFKKNHQISMGVVQVV